MSRYLAFTWSSGDAEAEVQAQTWRDRLLATGHYVRAFAHEGLDVWVGSRGPAVLALGDHGPVLIGDVFDRRSMEGPPKLPGLGTDPKNVAQRLTTDAWGAYVALLPDPSDASWWVLRDPSGSLPALSWRLGHLGAVADEIAALPTGLAPANLSLDWTAITEVLRRPYVNHHLSLLYGYTPITPGDMLRTTDAKAVAVWRPATFAGRASDFSHSDFRETLRGVMGALASVESRILVEVSGGFDSSLVVSALAEAGYAGRVAQAVHRYSARAEGDERHWARLVCEARDVELHCVPQTYEPLAEPDLQGLSKLAGPAFAGLDPPQDRDMARRVAETGATAIFGGHGGDAVFFQMPSAAVVGDILKARGVRGLCDPMGPAVARWLRCSIWTVLGEAQRRPLAGVESESWTQFWGERARDAARPPLHPWLQGLEGLGPAKQLQILMLLGCMEAWGRSHRGQAAKMVQPLLSQPVMEMCLALPAWRLLDGRRDRAFARDAFAPWLPPDIAARRAKGMLSVLYARRTAEGLPFLREYLLDGVLVDAGVLDRQALNAALQVDDLMWRGHGARLAWAAMLEGWVRYWQTRPPDRAA